MDNRYDRRDRSPPRGGGRGRSRYHDDPHARRGGGRRPMRKGEIYFDSAAEEREWIGNRRKKVNICVFMMYDQVFVCC